MLGYTYARIILGSGKAEATKGSEDADGFMAKLAYIPN